ncbi:MAG: MotA/TolQ/ExbB proton channel family protein [Planctomycetes bacterium]|nr:MotA/TolQ/ExbB proton channel family protein [Planctomycetota bacterium]
MSGWFRAGICSYLLLILALGAFSSVGFLSATVAQGAAAPAPEPSAEPVAEPEAPAPAEGDEDLAVFDDEEADPEAKPAEAAEEADTPANRSYLVWMYKALGIFYSLVFLILSFTLVALLVMNLLTARRESVIPAGLVEGFEAQLNEKKYQDAYELAKADESFLGQVLSAGLAKLSSGYQPAIEAMQEVGEEENMKLEHRLSYMALIGTISPMVGLLGTVQGMISSFSVIANSPTTPKPSQLAEGISTALFTTLVGLFIAIPAIAIYNILRNRVARLVLEVGIVSEGLMARFSGVGAKKT